MLLPAAEFNEFMRYKTEDEIFDVVRRFETGTILRGEWRHAEHLTVACYYCFYNDYETALTKMRGGIFKLLAAFGVNLTLEMPYNETLTCFWLGTIADFKNSKNGHTIVELTNRLLEIGADKNLPLLFYSRELLFSEPARARFIAPDLPAERNFNK